MNEILFGSLYVGVAFLLAWSVPIILIVTDREERNRIGKKRIIGLILLWISFPLMASILFFISL